jgi:hypothetical protein
MAARQFINVTTDDVRKIRRGNFGTITGSIPNTNKERGKPLKLIDGGVDLAGDGDPIEGFLMSFNAALETGGFPYCSYQWGGNVIATVVASGTHVAIGDPVVSAANTALGTVSVSITGDPVTGTAPNCPIVKKEASPTAGVKYWRVVDLRGGAGADGTPITIRFE